MPAELADAAALQTLISGLESSGLDRGTVAAIAHGNWLRVLGECLPE